MTFSLHSLSKVRSRNEFNLQKKLTSCDLGARAYYLHSVLHDWDDASCLKILRNIVPAMQPGYSKLLINENVVPNVGAPWSITSMDWLMMVLGGQGAHRKAEETIAWGGRAEGHWDLGE